ncbi:sensor domain-containing protein [Aliirhizobium smilacinae]|uniref:sensor domain-containing protein n=1 Tax=Aliirhizobium smilacinae TaxID=1395944 RepID=UPI001FE7C31F|nr:diguanylate cyclase [Rhizobium smilacinae]
MRDIGLSVGIHDAIPFAIVLLDRQGRFLHANKAFKANWSLSEPQLLTDLVPAEDRTNFLAELRHCESGADRQIELCLPQPDGTLRWAQVSLAVASARLDGPLVIAASFADITALKTKLADLEIWESRWNKALVGSSTGVWDHNWNRGEKYYSPTWRRIRGMSEDDPLAESTEAWLELVHPDDRDHVTHCIERQNAGDPAYTVFEYRERHKHGHWIWIECRGDCVEWDESGKPIRIVGTDTDITARKQAEEATARMARRLDMALEISGVGTYECDLTTGVVDWDDRMYRIYDVGRREDVRVGGLWETFLHPDDSERVLKNVDEHIENGNRFSDQYRVVLRDGSDRIIRARTMTFLDGNGHQMTVGANWDVTEDVGLHRELERAKLLAEARNSELEAAKDRIEHSAMHDYLTELPNRRYLDEVLQRMGAECRSNGTGIAILHVDLDRFKQINDRLGHDAGDAMLLHTARTLRATLSDEDFIARVGGDEFIVVSQLVGMREPLSSVAIRMIDALRKPVTYEGHLCRVGASIGIASEYGEAIDVRQLLRNSDIALYEAKRQGRNRYVHFSTSA